MPAQSGQESKQIAELRSSLKITQSFLNLVNRLEKLPNMIKVSYDRTRSLYHAVSKDRDMHALGQEFESFFGDPVKPAGKPLPIKFRMNPSVKYLHGVRDDQAFYVKRIRNGFYYGALWPWQKIKGNITVHLGYCGNKMSDKEYQDLERLVKSKKINEKLFDELGSGESQVHGIELPSFLYMALIEKITCTLEVTTSGAVGYLHLLNGELIAAQVGNLKNRAAAYEILSWDRSRIELQEPLGGSENAINQSLTEVFSEALRIRKDQKGGQGAPSVAAQAAVTTATPRERYQDLRATAKPSLLRRLLPAVAIGLGISGLLIVAAFIFQQYRTARVLETEYQATLAEVDAADSEIEKLGLLEEFIALHPDSAYVDDALDTIQSIQREYEDITYQEVMAEVERLPIDRDYEMKAAKAYKRYLEKYPEGRYADEIYNRMLDITDVVDDAEYERVVNANYPDYAERIKAYLGYLRNYPNGRNYARVEALLSEVAEEYFHHIQRSVPQCEQAGQWAPCIEMCDHFIDFFSQHPRAVTVRKTKRHLVEQKAYEALLGRIQNAGDDYPKIKQLYTAFLDEHPNTVHYREISDQIKGIDRRIRQVKEWNSVQAFSSNTDYRLTDRIAMLEQYVRQNPNGLNVDRAASKLSRLRAELEARRQQQYAAQQLEKQQAWQRRRNRIAKKQQLAEILIARAGRRFVSNGDGTVTDRQTGMMWTLLDTSDIAGRCMDYQAARSYVASLTIGGYGDWRLPTAGELAKIYKSPPFFKSFGAEWYWTDESFVRGYHEEALVVTTEQERSFKSLYKEVNQCGAARAVRQP